MKHSTREKRKTKLNVTLECCAPKPRHLPDQKFPRNPFDQDLWMPSSCQTQFSLNILVGVPGFLLTIQVLPHQLRPSTDAAFQTSTLKPVFEVSNLFILSLNLQYILRPHSRPIISLSLQVSNRLLKSTQLLISLMDFIAKEAISGVTFLQLPSNFVPLFAQPNLSFQDLKEK